jgi:hypothetical protein
MSDYKITMTIKELKKEIEKHMDCEKVTVHFHSLVNEKNENSGFGTERKYVCGAFRSIVFIGALAYMKDDELKKADKEPFTEEEHVYTKE